TMGLFSYPILMSADILMFNATHVPVGADQLQHIEMARDVASRFHAAYGETFVLPEAKLQTDTQYVLGTDGSKMSKSKDNTIDIFLPEKKLRKQVMSIATDSTPLEAPKNPDTCTVFSLYSLIANESEIATMRANYEAGGFGYGHAKQALYEAILERFTEARTQFDTYMQQPEVLEEQLQKGAEKARRVAHEVLQRVRKNIGFSPKSF
ncbi:MAG: tryptophan--tRNA ligase, partial [Flavobacteriaceae bacterium]